MLPPRHQPLVNHLGRIVAPRVDMNTLLNDRVGPRSKNLSNLVPTRLDLRLLAVARRLRCYRAHGGAVLLRSDPTIAAAYRKIACLESRAVGGSAAIRAVERCGVGCRLNKLMTTLTNIKVPSWSLQQKRLGDEAVRGRARSGCRRVLDWEPRF